MTRALTGFLVFNALLQLAVASMLLGWPERAVPAMFGVAYEGSLRMVVAALGVAVAVSVAVLGLAITWIAARDGKGLQLAALFGVWSCAAGAIYLLAFEQGGGLFDLLRGLLIVMMVLANTRELRRANI